MAGAVEHSTLPAVSMPLSTLLNGSNTYGAACVAFGCRLFTCYVTTTSTS